jgi:hypothetical protein
MEKDNYQLSGLDTKLQVTGRPDTSYIDKKKNVSWDRRWRGLFDSS